MKRSLSLAALTIAALVACQQTPPASPPPTPAPAPAASSAASSPTPAASSAGPSSPLAPEGSTGREAKTLAVLRKQAVATANPHASQAGVDILRKGGNAVDAAIASALVLDLTEPLSSGIGGGGLMLVYDAKKKALRGYDGRETAPKEAGPDLFLGSDGKPKNFYEAVVGGRSVGVPSELRMLEEAHKKHGKLPWADLLAPAIRLAREGFPVSKRLQRMLDGDRFLRDDPEAAAYFYDADKKAWPVGHVLKNPAYAATLEAVASGGADAFYQGPIAQDIVKKVTGHPTNPGKLALDDLKRYRAVERAPVCDTYRGHRVCGFGPPTSGGVAVLQILKMHELIEPAGVPRQQPYATHLLASVGNLAFADRNRYLGDPDFVSVPVEGLLDGAYLKQRAALFRKDASPGVAQPGTPRGASARADDASLELPSTSHVSIVDADGNAVSMTITVEDAFGSRQMVRGFLLNNELTDFSMTPEENGKPVANRVQGGKRPRSSMAPTVVFDRSGALHLVIGSPGGSAIINFVAQSVIAILDWGLDAQAALDLPHVGGRNGPVDLEKGTDAEGYKQALEALGHATRVSDMTSGLSAIQIIRGRIEAGVDPRKEGVALGD